ncbi:MAG: hypothetical protein M1369_02680 [Deinococcus sp.]|nr:hypothetical protein [Deinococcus sp.]MCL5964677.1 hypothetical protein [Deinococcus sp.]
MRLEVCSGCHLSPSGEEGFASLLSLLQEKFSIGYFGGKSPMTDLEVEFVPCLDHCGKGFSVAVEGDVLVLSNLEDFEVLFERVSKLLAW